MKELSSFKRTLYALVSQFLATFVPTIKICNAYENIFDFDDDSVASGSDGADGIDNSEY